MIVARFGDTYGGAYVIGQNAAIDDYTGQRPSVAARVGGMNGSFDYYGSSNYPLLSLPVRKNFTVVGWGSGTAGTGTISGSHSVTGGGVTHYYLDGSGTSFDTETQPGYIIVVGNDPCKVVLVSSSVLVEVESYTSNTGSYSIYSATPTNIGVEYALDALRYHTISKGESKLWFLRRDGGLRWAWAKCTSLKVADQVGNVYHLPASIEFFCREGVWKNETAHTQAITQANTSYTIVNAGNTPAMFSLTFTPATGTLTNLVVANTTNSDTFTYAANVTVGNSLVVDTAAYTITNNFVGDYANFTYGANQVNWLRLNPGSNTITFTVTGSTAWGGNISWYDTYS